MRDSWYISVLDTTRSQQSNQVMNACDYKTTGVVDLTVSIKIQIAQTSEEVQKLKGGYETNYIREAFQADACAPTEHEC